MLRKIHTTCLALLVLCGQSDAQTQPTITFAFSHGKPKPYVLDADQGLEVEIVQQAFAAEGYKVNGTLLTYKRMARIKSLDIDGHGVTFPKEGNGLFYSEPYVYYRDVAIWKKRDDLALKTIKDMTAYKVGGWQTAPEDMGGDLVKYFGEKGEFKQQFTRSHDDESLTKMLWANRLDILVQDLLIYDYFHRKLEQEQGKKLPYAYDYLSFPEQNWFHAVFKKQEHRDAFNRGLVKIKENGTFDQIYAKYAQYTDF